LKPTATHGGGDDDDVSASDTSQSYALAAGGEHGGGVRDADVAGFCLCFLKLPVVSLAFLEYLANAYATSLTTSYVWFNAPPRIAHDPVLVVNIVRASAPLATAAAVVQEYVPRGFRTPSKRARA
jgi:hypothetical protein